MTTASSIGKASKHLSVGRNNPKGAAPAVLRAARIIDLLSQSHDPMSLADLALELDMPKSSLHGLCVTLAQLRLITKLESGHMAVGPHVMVWANAFLGRSNFAQEFNAAWEDVRIMPEETVTLSILDGASVVYVACRNGNRPLGITFRIGMRLPAPFTATGKAMLSTMPESEVETLLESSWPVPLTPTSTRSLDALKKELIETRERGFSIDDGQTREGMHCFGAPVFDSSGKAIAAVAVSVLSHDVDDRSLVKAGGAIRLLADRISERLGAAADQARPARQLAT